MQMRIIFDFEMEEIAPIVDAIIESFEEYLKPKKEETKNGKQTNKR